MTYNLPRIDAVSVPAPMTLRIRWIGSPQTDDIDLTGWIAMGGDLLEQLKSRTVFERAKITGWGTAVSWDRGEGDLSIDAVHLARLANEQRRAP